MVENIPSVFTEYSSVTLRVQRTKEGMNKQMLTSSQGLSGYYTPSATAGARGSREDFTLWLQDLKVILAGDSLTQECKYLLWNNSGLSIAAYGMIRCVTTINSEIDLRSAVIKFGTQLRDRMGTDDVSRSIR